MTVKSVRHRFYAIIVVGILTFMSRINFVPGYTDFIENFIFGNCLKRLTCDWKFSQLGYDLPISVVDRVISRGFYFYETTHMRSLAKIKPSRKFSNLQ